MVHFASSGVWEWIRMGSHVWNSNSRSCQLPLPTTTPLGTPKGCGPYVTHMWPTCGPHVAHMWFVLPPSPRAWILDSLPTCIASCGEVVASGVFQGHGQLRMSCMCLVFEVSPMALLCEEGFTLFEA